MCEPTRVRGHRVCVLRYRDPGSCLMGLGPGSRPLQWKQSPSSKAAGIHTWLFSSSEPINRLSNLSKSIP
ncbi:hypothetical protein DV515_00010176 [Chloebia gouldiae]|uniref:Uncharacterized protein n=1 Tax=Chloebia gouldiae TaxID=44316 RepID=A0A3L8SAC6_CHLGU|nr:hypothetical protein DV515_00010176 [Chloebia gouldiae]